MITADQIIVHLVGDFLLQSDWMARNKTKKHFPAFCHALLYSVAFLVFKPSFFGWCIIFSTHFFIDRYRLAVYLVWFKNSLCPTSEIKPFNGCLFTGYPKETPDFLAVWLLIIADNIIHILINGASLKYL